MVKPGYKQTEVGVIPEDWEIESIAKNSIIKARIGWKGLTTSEYLVSGDYFLVTGTDFFEGKIFWDNCFFVDEKRYSQDKYIQLHDSDILVTKDGTIGKIAYIDKFPGNATLNSGIFVIRPINNAYYPLYFYYILDSIFFISFLRQLQAGSTISHLYQRDIIGFFFPLPIPSEQRAIAEALFDVDALIAALDKLIAKKRAVKTAAMQQLLTGRIRLPGFSGEWLEKPLGEIANIIMGQSPSSSFYNNKAIGLPLIQGNADINNRKTIIRNYTSQVTKRCSDGDIILSVRAPVGEVAKANFDACVGRGVCAISYPNEYLYHYLIFLEPHWSKFSTGSTFDSVNSDVMKSLIIRLPNDIKEQEAIARILDDIDTEISDMETRREKTHAVKQGMLQELLTGKTRLLD